MRIDRPKDTEPCASEKCGHPFGDHYLSHDGKTSGCSVDLNDPEKPMTGGLCRCTGFLVRYLYKPRTRTSKVKP